MAGKKGGKKKPMPFPVGPKTMDAGMKMGKGGKMKGGKNC